MPETIDRRPRTHGQSDGAVANSGLGDTILRPTFFQDNVLNFSADTLKSQRTFHGASGDQAVAYVSSKDVAAVVLLACGEDGGPTNDVGPREQLDIDFDLRQRGLGRRDHRRLLKPFALSSSKGLRRAGPLRRTPLGTNGGTPAPPGSVNTPKNGPGHRLVSADNPSR